VAAALVAAASVAATASAVAAVSVAAGIGSVRPPSGLRGNVAR
jgi:hypothetical protein